LALDILSPSRDEMILIRVVAMISEAALSECELVLCVYKGRRPVRVHPIDAAGPQHAISNDILVFAGCDGASDF